jgi:predicted exporter
MGSHTEFSTLNTLEFHSAAEECSLLDVLETGSVPQKFFLSGVACQGILRRAEKRNKKLPEQLALALVAASEAKTQNVGI